MKKLEWYYQSFSRNMSILGNLTKLYGRDLVLEK